MSELNDDIRRYLNGDMTAAERHALERKALDDPFLADALEGAESVGSDEFAADVSEIHRRVKAGRSIFTPFRIAAGIIALAISGFLVYQFSVDQKPEMLTLESKSAEVIGDSLKNNEAKEPIEEVKDGDEAGPVKEAEKPQVKPKPSEARPKSEVEEKERIAQVTPADDQTEKAEVTQDVKTDESKLSTEALELKEETSLEKLAEAQPVIQPRPTTTAGISADKKMARAKSASTSSGVIQGTVTSAEDGSALPGINVIIKGTTTGTVTDAAGHYQIETGLTDPTLVFSFIGLKTEEKKVRQEQTVNVALQADVAELSEVVVTGYGVSGGNDSFESQVNYPTLQLTQPIGGKDQFQEYLKQNVRYPALAKENNAEGRVTVQFTVGANGDLSDFTVIRDIGYGCADELIRAIKEGPKWTPSQRNGIAIDDKVRVRFKFELP